jgi:8-oxo-dGTP pyrophosphatase MutT (NUDIX family)
MSTGERAVVYEGGRLFRVEHQPVPGRDAPYEFIRRIGATTVLPITNIDGEPHVVAILNNRAFYGASFGLPGGNADGGFDRPEHPTLTGLRETKEEIGYGYWEGVEPNVDTFVMRPISSTILYDRSFSVARGLEYIGGELHSPHEIITASTMPLQKYIDPLFRMNRGELYPEINLAIAKAGQEVGHTPVIDWLANGGQSQYAAAIVQSFEPWMTPVPPA